VKVGQTAANVTSLTVNNLAAGSTNYFYVAASNATSSASTAWVSVVMPAAAKQLTAPKVTATATSTTTGVVSWSASAGATGYTIYQWTGSQAVKLGNVSASTTSVTINGLKAGSTNYFYVAAFNATNAVTSSCVTLVTPAKAAVTTHAALTASMTDMVFNTIGIGRTIVG